MKRIIIIAIISLHSLILNAQAPIADTLQWLKNNIEHKKQLFTNKPLNVLLDSLKELKNGIAEYDGPDWYAIGHLNDTIWVKGINLYFEETVEKDAIHYRHFFSNGLKDTINTHIKTLKIDFAWPVPFLRKWWSYDKNGLGSSKWNAKIETLFKNEWISDVKVEEY